MPEPSPELNRSSAEQHKSAHSSQGHEFKIEIDPKVGKTLQDGLNVGFDAIGQLLNGFVNSIKDSVAPEVMKNYSAGQWLAQVAAVLNELAVVIQSGQSVAPSKSGELAFYLEQIEFALEGSRVQPLAQSLKDRLTQILLGIQQGSMDPQSLQETLGYFQAASKSSLPPTSN